MIHIGLPSPALWRMMLRARFAVGNACRQARRARGAAAGVVGRLGQEADAAVPATDGRRAMSHFEGAFEEFASVLRRSARRSPSDADEGRFRDARERLLAAYDAVRPLLQPCVRQEGSADPFISLLEPPSLVAARTGANVPAAVVEARRILRAWHRHWDSP